MPDRHLQSPRPPERAIVIRRAGVADVPAIVALLADDPLGKSREDASLPLAESYFAGFAAVDCDPNQVLAVAEADGHVVGTLQVSFIPGLARRGAWRGQIEAVRIAREQRNGGLGQTMILWALAECRKRGCAMVQLTTDKTRPDAHRFYERLGFEASHVGYKINLARPPAAAGD